MRNPRKFEAYIGFCRPTRYDSQHFVPFSDVLPEEGYLRTPSHVKTNEHLQHCARVLKVASTYSIAAPVLLDPHTVIT